MTIVWGYLPFVLLCWAGAAISFVSIKFDRWLIGPRRMSRPARSRNLALAIVRLDIFENWLGILFLGALSILFLLGMFGAF